MASRRKNRRSGSIRDLGDGRYVIRLSAGRDGAKRVRPQETVYGSATDARKRLNELSRQQDQGLPLPMGRQRLGEWIDEWLTDWSKNVSERTRWDRDALFKRYLPAQMRTRKLTELTAIEVQRWINEMSGRGLSPRTVAMVHGALRTCLYKAMRLGKVAHNVAAHADLPRKEHRECLFFSADEAKRFREAIRGTRWEALFVLLLHTGVRPGEALALRWDDVENGALWVRRGLSRIPGKAPIVSSTKTCKTRSIPLGSEVREVLAQHRRSQVEWRLKIGAAYIDQNLIFADEFGGFADGQNITNRHFKPILVRAKLPKLRLYDLRHTCATLLLAAGEHPKVVQERLGHQAISITMNVYTHLLPGIQERASHRLEELLGASTMQGASNA